MAFKRSQLSSGALLALGGVLLAPLWAQAQDVQRVEITGSAIRRINAETALPVTIIRTEELTALGVTTVEQALKSLASNQSNFGSSSAIGGTTGAKAEADLRGLSGPFGSSANKTLVLLNGRRLANHSFDSAAVDLNAIPLAAVERIEVLRDGASALYGTDAIGGVINFILKRDYRGVEVSASYQQPEAGSAGSIARASVVAGFGSLDADRFNVLAALDVRKQKVLAAVDRKFGSTGILGTTRNDISDGTSGSAFPGDVDGFEPSAPNCDPPFSIPRNTNPDNSGAFGSCRYDFTKSIDLIPENEQITGLVRASFALGGSHVLSAEVLHARNKAIARVAPAPNTHLILATSPFFPAGAPTRDLDALIPFFGVTDPNPGGPTLGGAANWRQVPAGKRTSGDDTINERFMLDLEGLVAGIDYRASVGRARNESTASVIRGYVNDSIMQQGVWDGLVNPFGTHADPTMGQTPAGLAVIESAQVQADTVLGKSTLDFAALRGSKDIFQLSGGNAAVAFGVEYRSDKSSFENTDITAELGSLGLDPNADTSGKRHSSGVFAELGLPVLKTLDLTLAARYDKYSDFGGTFNPKVAFKFTPVEGFALRGSANKGFRAPTLYEIYQPQALSFTTDNYDDPLLCPGGAAVAGTSAGVVCGQQVLIRTVGPVGDGRPASALEPETSKAFSVGFVLEPARNLSFTADFWQIKIRNLINGLPEQEIFANPAYASRFVRCSAVAAGQVPGFALGDIDACANLSATQDPIAFINSPTENLGELHVSGVDLSANWRLPTASTGVFDLSFDGTYITKYRYQRERNGAFINAAGRYSDNAPIFRWQHVLGVNWTYGTWGVQLAQRYKSGYTDQGGDRKVGAYLIHDAALTYSGIKNLALTFGVANLFDKEPPLTVQSTTFQRGYDPRFTDPLGRTYLLRASYKFF